MKVAKKVLPNYKQTDLIQVFYDFDKPDAEEYGQMDTFQFEKKFKQAKKVYGIQKKLAKNVQKHCMRNKRDLEKQFEMIDPYDEGVRVPDIKLVLERVSFDITLQEVQDLIYFYRLKKNSNEKLFWKELVRAIFKEDFNTSGLTKKEIRPESIVMNRIRKELSSYKNIDFKSILERYDEGGHSGKQLISKKYFLKALEEVGPWSSLLS